MEFVHKSIMLEEVIESLAIKPNGIYVDGTLGGAGHASEVCRKLSAKGRFIGIDKTIRRGRKAYWYRSGWRSNRSCDKASETV